MFLVADNLEYLYSSLNMPHSVGPNWHLPSPTPPQNMRFVMNVKIFSRNTGVLEPLRPVRNRGGMTLTTYTLITMTMCIIASALARSNIIISANTYLRGIYIYIYIIYISRLGISRVTLRNFFRGSPALARLRAQPRRARSHHHAHQSAIATKALFSLWPEGRRHQERGITREIILTRNYIIIIIDIHTTKGVNTNRKENNKMREKKKKTKL